MLEKLSLHSDPTTSANLQLGSGAAPQRAWISLGGNMPWNGMIGVAVFEAALSVLEAEGLQLIAASRLWTGPAWPDPSEPPFFNAVAEGRWTGRPEELLDLLLKTEAAFGRTRGAKNAPRTLDLDLLDMERSTGQISDYLVLPHPRIGERAFVLGPLSDVSPDWRDRNTGQSAQTLLNEIENKENFRALGDLKLRIKPNSAKP